jgi:N-dimethylarginine dimethylaminohydrolase
VPPFATNEFGHLGRLVVKHAFDAFRGPEAISSEWRSLRFTAPPGFGAAVREYDRFLELLSVGGVEVLRLPRASGATLDSIYVRDASVASPRGMILGRMGKPERDAEPAAQDAAFLEWGVPVAGAIQRPGLLEGGDVVWLDGRTVIVGQGYRTNAEGVRQFRELLGDSVDEVVVVPLPHWRGPGDVFHLMSFLSPVDRDLAVVYSPLMPVPFRQWLLERGVRLVEVPADEFESMGANVLALGPRRCVMVAGNPRTRALLEEAGAQVLVYSGEEISLKGGGGPTCLTRPIERR